MYNFTTCTSSNYKVHLDNVNTKLRVCVCVCVCAQSCVIEVLGVTTLTKEENTERRKANGGLIAGFITAQGRATEQDTSGFVFNKCSIVGVGKAFLGRAYRGYSRVLFCNTNMADVIVHQGWDSWGYQGQV